MKQLPPTMREDYRHLEFAVRSGAEKDLGDVVEAVWNASLDYLGTSGTSEADPWIIGNRFSEEEQTGVVKVRKDMVDEFRAALAVAEDVAGEPGFFHVTSVSGSLEGLE